MGSDPKEFFDALKEKLEAAPSRRTDRAFWHKFEDEFGQRRSVRVPTWFDWRWAAPVAMTALLLIVLVPRWRSTPDLRFVAESDMMGRILESAPMLQELDLFTSSPGGQLSLAELSDEEWNILLNEENG